jgi:hypothetical protein
MGIGTCVRRRMVLSVCAALALACLVGAPAPAGAQEQAPIIQRLLALAPAGTWAAFAVDMEQVLASAPMKRMPEMGAELPPELTGMKGAAYFILPSELPLNDTPDWCGVVLIDPQTKADWEAGMAEEGGPGTTGGLATYSSRSGIKGFATDELLLMAGKEEAFTALAQAQSSGSGPGLSERLAKLLQAPAGAMMVAAAALPAPLSKMFPEESVQSVPPFLMGATDVALNARLGEDLALSGFARLGSAEDAQQALVAAQAGLMMAKGAMNEQIREEPFLAFAMLPFFTVLDSLKIDVQEAEFHGSVQVDLGQISTFGMMGVLPYYMFRSMGGRTEMDDMDMAGQFNLHEIGLGIAMYQNAHDGQYPPNLAAIVQEGFIEDASALVDPADTDPQAIGDTGVVSSYEFVGPLPKSVDASTIVCYTRKGVRPEGRYVLSADMALALVSEDELHNADGLARTSLRASYNGVIAAYGGALTEERKAELKKFYEIEE